MRIAVDLIEEETMRNLAGAYVSQVESSDYDETPFQERVDTAIELAKKGDIVIIFSEEFNAPTLLSKNECIERFGSVPALAQF